MIDEEIVIPEPGAFLDSGVGTEPPHPMLTTSFEDYTVTEGLLLLLLLSLFACVCFRLLKGGFSWLR